MKKRTISLLLTLVMLMSLCAGLGTSASAATGTKTVTLQNGDTVLKLCERNGVDFYANKQQIMALNGITNENQFYKLSAGTQIVLPDPNATATTAAATTPAAVTTPIAAAAPATSLQTANAQALPAGDHASYYLVSYTVQPGETIGGIYANWGLSYRTYDNQIKKLNSIVSYNSIKANSTLLLPTTNPAMANSAYYTVMAHTMKSGESAYNIVCDNYKLNYSANQNMLTALNNTNNLANIQAGRTLYIPVAGVVTASSVVSTSTAATTTTATVSASANYNLVSQTSANGSFDLQVNGMSVSTARAGSVVTVVATPNVGYTLDTIRVVKVGDASTVVGVSGTSFTMPSYSVIVSVTFKAAKYRNISTANVSNGSVAAMVNGTKVTGAYVGNTVYVKTIPATGFMLDNVRVTYNNGRDSVAVYNNIFNMPDTDVEILATFKKDPDYDPTQGHAIYTDASYGEVRTFIGNSEVFSAKAGDRVTVEVTPNKNYTVQSVAVYYDDFRKTADIDKNSFTMPDAPVTIIATIKPTASATFDMTKVTTTDGTFDLLVDGKSANYAKIGANVVIKGSPKSSAYYYLCTVTKTGDTSVSVPVIYNEKDGTSSFVMPDYPVSVRVKFYRYHKIILDASNGTYGSFAVVAGNNRINTCAEGVNLTVNIWGVKAGYSASNVILTYADGSTYTLDGANFIMPDCDVKVKVNFSAKQTVTAHAITVNGEYGKFGNTYTVAGKTLNGNKAAAVEFTAGIGANVIVTPNAAFGYEVDTIFCNYVDRSGNPQTIIVGKNPVTEKYQFQMPELKNGTKLDLYVTFKPITTYPVALDYASDNNLSHEKGTFNVTTINNSAFVDHAVYGAKLMLRVYPAGGYAVDLANVKVINQNTGALVEVNKNDYTFIMPQAPVVISVPFVETSYRIRLERTNNGIDGQSKGRLSAIINGVEYTDDQLVYLSEDGVNNYVGFKFEAGTLVTIVNSSRSGYVLNSEQPIVVKKMKDGQYINYKTLSGDHFSFDMPNSDVTVSAQYIDDMIAVNAVPSTNGTFTVPKQVAWNGELVVDNIYPASGYQLDKILLTYVGHDGTAHIQEELNGTRLNLAPEGGMLKSDITVEVLFKPALNPLTIHYAFDDAPDASGYSNYKVQLIADGADISSRLTRSYDLSLDADGKYSGYNDVLNKTAFDAEGNEVDIGLKTGTTVIINRDEFKADKNFSIVNIYISFFNGTEMVAIKPEFANGQYYFTVPYVPSGLAKDLVVNIQYAKDTPDSFALTAIKAAGFGGNAVKTAFEMGGVEVGKGKINEEITVKLTADAYSVIADEATVVFTNGDGTPVRYPVTGSAGEFTIPSDLITSMPQSKAVTLEYVSNPMSYAVDVHPDCEVGALTRGYVLGETVEPGDVTEIPWGATAAIALVPKPGDYTIDSVSISYTLDGVNETVEELLNDGSGYYKFTMPKAAVNVIVKYVNSYTVRYEYAETANDIDGKVLIHVGEAVYENTAKLGSGKVFSVEPYIADGTFLIDSVDGADDNYDGTYTMRDENVTIRVTFTKNDHPMNLTLVPPSVIPGVTPPNFFVEINGVQCTDPSEYATIRYKDFIRVYAQPDPADGVRYFNVTGLNVHYIDKDGNAVNSSIAEVTGYEDGSASFRITKIPAAAETVVAEVVFSKNANFKYALNTVLDDGAALPNDNIKVTYNVGNAVKAGTQVVGTIQLRYCYAMDETMIKVVYNNVETGNPETVNLTGFKQTSKISDNKTFVTYAFAFNMPAGDTVITLHNPTSSELVDGVTVTTAGCQSYDGDGKASTKFNLSDSIYLVFNEKADHTALVRVSFNTDETKSFVWEQNGIVSGDSIDMATVLGDKGLPTNVIPMGGKVKIEVIQSPII